LQNRPKETAITLLPMPKLNYTSRNFPIKFAPALAGTKTIDVTWAEIIWAALSVGKAESGHLIKHGVLSWYELLMRLYLLKVNFKESLYPFAEFEQTAVYKALDPSEKTSLSYFMGLTTAKLLSNRFLGVPWLVHLDSLDPSRLKFNSKQRPDLIGLDKRTEWLVMEAKGRSGKLSKDLIPKALQQTNSLATIDGKAPFLRVACAAYASADILRAHWECPKLSATVGANLILQPIEFLDRYYASIRNLINSNNQSTTGANSNDNGVIRFVIPPYRSSNNPDAAEARRVFRFNTVTLSDLDLRIGLLNEPSAFFLANPDWHDALLRSESFQGQFDNFNQQLFIASDGILVQLGSSWNSENMRQEPNERAANSSTYGLDS
jgi:hypothetical protein